MRRGPVEQLHALTVRERGVCVDDRCARHRVMWCARACRGAGYTAAPATPYRHTHTPPTTTRTYRLSLRGARVRGCMDAARVRQHDVQSRRGGAAAECWDAENGGGMQGRNGQRLSDTHALDHNTTECWLAGGCSCAQPRRVRVCRVTRVAGRVPGTCGAGIWRLG